MPYLSKEDVVRALTSGNGSQFSPQGNTGGGFNMPGYLADGRPAIPRSESVEYELARRDMLPPVSTLGALFNPQWASFVDAINTGNAEKMFATGYSPSNPPGK